MLQVILVLTLVIHQVAFSKQLELDLVERPQPPRQLELSLPDPSEKDIVAPVLIRKNNQEQLALFTAEPTAQNPNFLSILRAEMEKIEAAAQIKNQNDGVFKSTSKRFPTESLAFFVAIGAVTFNSMWIKSQGDPLAMERHILSLKDPIAHLSFFTFMQTQGYYMDIFSKRAGISSMEAATRQRMMRRLTYEGMAWASLASSIVADLGQSAKMCIDSWITNRNDPQSHAMCDEAWKNWTARNKFSQYFPQIISLWAAQATTEFLEAGGRHGFNKATNTNLIKKLLSSKFLVNQAYKITGADVALTFSGGGWAIKSIRLVGKVTRFSFFVGIDHFLANYTYRPLNNLIKPLFVDFDALEINRLWYEADEGVWNQNTIKNKKNAESFAKEIENYTMQMQQWRDHLNQDAETDLAGWLEMTKKLLNQADLSYKYYKGFIDNLFELLNRNHLVEQKQLDPSALNVITGYPLRTLPFYGVIPYDWATSKGRVEDLYITSLNELELRQKEHVIQVASKFKEVESSFKGSDLLKIQSLIEKLVSGDKLKMASGLNDLNKILDLDLIERTNPDNLEQRTTYSRKFIEALEILRKGLGNPRPVVYPFAGYSQAFASHSLNFSIDEAADFSRWSILKKYNFNKTPDLLFYHMICGSEKADFYKIQVKGVNFLSPQFVPPTILKSEAPKSDFCSKSLSTNTLYSQKVSNLELNEFVIKYLNYSIVGDFRNNKKSTAVIDWWSKQTKEPLAAAFKSYDEEFKKVFQLAYENFFDQRSFFKFFVDGLNQSKYLPKSLQASLKAESNMYLQILNRTLLEDSVSVPFERATNSPVGNSFLSKLNEGLSIISPLAYLGSSLSKKLTTHYNYVEFAKLNSENQNFESIYKKTHPEIIKLNNLYEAYYGFISTPNIDFNQYISFSKKIDTSINDILVNLKLKKLSSQSQTEDLSGSSNPSTTGTELTDAVYEDMDVKDPNYKQLIAIAAIKGLKHVESEIRRFIRMRIALSQSLELDQKEFMDDWNNSSKSPGLKQKKTNPFGGGH